MRQPNRRAGEPGSLIPALSLIVAGGAAARAGAARSLGCMAEGVGEGRAVRVPGAPVALSTASVYPQACADAFVFAADLGYDGIEVMVWTDPVSQEVSSLRGLVDHYQVPVLAIHAPTL